MAVGGENCKDRGRPSDDQTKQFDFARASGCHHVADAGFQGLVGFSADWGGDVEVSPPSLAMNGCCGTITDWVERLRKDDPLVLSPSHESCDTGTTDGRTFPSTSPSFDCRPGALTFSFVSRAALRTCACMLAVLRTSATRL
jgi:hypothetical protein